MIGSHSVYAAHMTAGFWSAFVDGAGRLLDVGGLRAKRGARDPHEAARQAIRDAWDTVGGEYWTAVAQERAALGADARTL